MPEPADRPARDSRAERTAGAGATLRAHRAAAQVPLLLFDGDCGFCTAVVDWLASRLGRRARALPWQHADLGGLGLERDEAADAVWWIEPAGDRFRGHRAVAKALEACGAPWSLAGSLLEKPGIRRLAAAGYGVVSRNRHRLPGTQPANRRGADTPPTGAARLRPRE